MGLGLYHPYWCHTLLPSGTALVTSQTCMPHATLISYGLNIYHVTYMAIHLPLIEEPMVPSVPSIHIGKYNIFQRPDEAMLFVMVKAHLYLKIFLFSELSENSALLTYSNKCLMKCPP